ncbi:MAG: DUF2232 domain-containing protein [Anaerorhabdus sp.]
MNKEVRKITEGAMMLAIIGVLLLMNRQFFGLVESFFWIIPLPMVFFSAKYGLKASTIPLFGVVFLTFLFGTMTSIFFFCSMSICGAIYGAGVRKQYSREKLLLFCIVWLIFANLMTTVLFASFFGYNIVEEIAFLEASLTQLGVTLGFPGRDSATILFQLYVASTVLYGVLSGIVLHILSLQMLKRLRFDVAILQKNTGWIAPWWSGPLALGMVFLGNALALMPSVPSDVLGVAFSLMSLSVFYLVYFGLLVAMRWAMKKVGKKKAFLLTIMLVILITYTMIILMVVGAWAITTKRLQF